MEIECFLKKRQAEISRVFRACLEILKPFVGQYLRYSSDERHIFTTARNLFIFTFKICSHLTNFFGFLRKPQLLPLVFFNCC